MDDQLKRSLINKADEIIEYAENMKEFAQEDNVASYVDWAEQIKFELDNILKTITDSKLI